MRNQARQLDPDLEIARGQMYAFFAAVLLNRPDQNMLAGLLSEPALSSLRMVFSDHPACTNLTRLAGDYSQGLCNDEDFLLDYEALFRVPGDFYTHPYESAYLTAGEGGRRKGVPSLDPNRTRRVIAAYQRLGLSPGDAFGEQPDHIGVELDFMSWLCHSIAEALQNGDTEEALRLSAEGELFAGEHLLGWSDGCLSKIEDNAATVFYRCIAALAKSFLVWEQERNLSVILSDNGGGAITRCLRT